jgi:membrane-associated phospholipid phosphatase
MQPNRSLPSSAYVTRLVRLLRKSWRIWLTGLIVVGGSTSLFLSLAGEVLEQENFRWDAPLMLAIHQRRTPWLDHVMIGITWIGHPGEYLITAICLIWLWRHRMPVAAGALVVSTVGAGLLNMKSVWAVLALLFALLIAFSRIYLGLHYPSDIVAALAVSVVWLAIVIAGYHDYRRRLLRNAKSAPTASSSPRS